ncbi:hypothetical protein AVEN_270514-1 [Araneus ventricosus]|uniref:Uncharacterized protein n=1 Tax=Araneus ventricosus TaxID=182803 RepID=A0A4Y2B612_ARAVE|nr:hypothetical protein AVEN_270514-1 [Araneus ventricosus]
MARRETHPQTMTFPPLCFIAVIWNLGSKRVSWGRRIHCIPSVRNNMYLLSSLQRTSSHSFFGPVLERLLPFHKRLAILRRDQRFLDGLQQSSCLKPTPDSTNRWFRGSQSSRAMSTAVRRGLTRERRKSFLSKKRDVERGRPDLRTFGTPP